MPVSDSASTSRRLLGLLSLLQARRDWPARVLAERLGVSERTVRRDVERLRELDYAIEATRGPDGGYRLGAGDRMPPLLFDEQQAVAVALALRSAAAVGAGIAEDAERALQTVTRMLPRHLAPRLALDVAAIAPAAGPDDTEADSEVLVRIGAAIHDREELRFDYRSPRGSERDETAEPRRIEPHHVLLHGGRWYLLGFDAERSQWRTLRVDRILPRSHTGRRFTPREVPGGDPGRYLAARFKGSEERDTWACWGEATMAAALRDVAPFVGDGRVEELRPGACRVRLGAWSWDAVAASFSRFAVDVMDVEPIELRDAFARLAARAERAASSPS